MPEFSISTARNWEMIDITGKVQELVGKSGIRDGICVVYIPHTTAAITINENSDPDVCEDILLSLSRIVPKDAGYRHSEGSNNAAAHVKSSIVGTSKIVPLRAGKLALGQWQGIMFCEFDGPRQRRVIVEMLSK